MRAPSLSEVTVVIVALVLAGCAHRNHQSTEQAIAPGIVCASVYVAGVERSVFISGGTKVQGEGETCGDAYADWKAKR